MPLTADYYSRRPRQLAPRLRHRDAGPSSLLPSETGGIPTEMMDRLLGLRRRRSPDDDFGPVYETPAVAPAIPDPLPTRDLDIIATLPRVRPTMQPMPPIDAGAQPLIDISGRRPRVLAEAEGIPEAHDAVVAELRRRPLQRAGLKELGLSALQGLLMGGPGGAIGAAAMTGLDRELPARFKRDRAIAEEEAVAGGLRQRRRGALQDQLLESQVQENLAQAEARRNPRPPRPIRSRETLEDGTTISTTLNPETGQYEPELNASGEPVVLARPRPRPSVRVPTELGELEVSPDAALTYLGQRGKLEGEANAARVSVTEAEAAQQDALGKRKVASETVSTLRGELRNLVNASPWQRNSSGQIVDPGYWDAREELESRIKETQDEATYWQRQADDYAGQVRKGRGEAARGGSSTSSPRWSASRWAAANKGGDVEAAKRAAKAAGYAVVD